MINQSQLPKVWDSIEIPIAHPRARIFHCYGDEILVYDYNAFHYSVKQVFPYLADIPYSHCPLVDVFNHLTGIIYPNEELYIEALVSFIDWELGCIFRSLDRDGSDEESSVIGAWALWTSRVDISELVGSDDTYSDRDYDVYEQYSYNPDTDETEEMEGFAGDD